MRRLPIDWPGLLEAVHAQEEGAVRWYLDLETGAVISADDGNPGVTDAEGPDLEHDPERFLLIPGESGRPAWRRRSDFARTVAEPLQRARLEDALEGKGAFSRFQRVLAEESLRDAWFRFDATRALQTARDWLDAMGIDPVNPPPQEPAAESPPQPVAGHAPLGLTELLMLGAPDGRTEILDGQVWRQVVAADEAEARAIFQRVIEDIHALEHLPLPQPMPTRQHRTGRWTLRQDGRTLDLEVHVLPEQVRAFWR